MKVSINEKAEARFWSKVSMHGPDDCWPWMAGVCRDGYGSFWANGKNQKAHRVALSLSLDSEMPRKLLCLHSCHNPACCNPSHLRWGTVQDNTDDRNRAGRQASGDRQGLRKHPESAARGDRHGARKYPESRPRGEANGRAKFTTEQVQQIFVLRSEGLSYKKIANKFLEQGIKCSDIAIGLIVRGVNRRSETDKQEFWDAIGMSGPPWRGKIK